MLFHNCQNVNASKDDLKIQNGVIFFIKGIFLISQNLLETKIEKDVVKSYIWDFKLQVSPKNYFCISNNSLKGKLWLICD